MVHRGFESPVFLFNKIKIKYPVVLQLTTSDPSQPVEILVSIQVHIHTPTQTSINKSLFRLRRVDSAETKNTKTKRKTLVFVTDSYQNITVTYSFITFISLLFSSQSWVLLHILLVKIIFKVSVYIPVPTPMLH